MRRNAQVFAMVLLLVLSGIPKALALYTPTPFSIDGNLEEWIKADAIAYGRDSGLPGANLDKLYIAWDDNYLYIAIKTNNTQSWDLAYGIGIDVDPGSGNGYTGDSDAWGRKIAFGNNYAIDYEIYFWWSGGSGITADNFINWTGSGWDYKSISDVGGSFAYTGDTSQGLQTLEIAIPWDALGGITRKFAIIAWIAGGDGSSAVDTAPSDSEVPPGDSWTDYDKLSNLATTFEFPDLTVEIKGPDVVGVNKLAEYEVHVKNLGGIGVPSTKVRVYINGTLYKNWTVSLGPKEEKVLTFNWTPTQEGMYRINATVDEENTVVELNENNNVATFDVSVVWVGKISVDGDPSDWPEVSLNNNTFTLQNGVFIWSDAPDDQRTEKDPYLPGGTSSHADLIKFGVAKDERYLYFLFVFKNMSNIKIGDNGATFIAVPIDFKEGGATEFAGEMDTKSILEWDIQVVVNLASSQFSGERVATTKAGSSYESLFYVLSADGSFITSDDAMVGVNLDANTVEVRIPLSFIENSDEIRLQLATGFSYGPAVWNFGDPFANDDVSDIVDTISEAGTEEELSDNIPDYYVKLLLGTYLVEGADVINYREERIMMQQQAAVKSFMTISKYYGIPRFKKEYATYLELMNNITNMDIPEEFKEEIIEIRKKVDELFSLYKEGKEVAEEGMMSLADAIKLYRAYTGMIKVNQRLKEIIQAIASGELERQKWLEEMRGKLTKTIDGDLSDWSVDPVAVDTEGYGQDGANLKELYVDYDDNFLYIAFTTDNKASWRIAYGVALDYKEGGYTTGQDGWQRKVEFERGIDAQLYFFWNGEFFGNPGTDSITSADLILWKNGTWEYMQLDKVGFYAYKGGSNGLQSLEIAVPWEVLGGKPEKIAIVVYITGQGAGDSAVDSLPLQDAVKDSDNEWGDVDKFTKFAEVLIK